MQAGSPAQMEFIKTIQDSPEFKTASTYPKSHYDAVKEFLTVAGLQPDPNYIHNGKPYSYGSAWLMRELPAEIVAEVEAMNPKVTA